MTSITFDNSLAGNTTSSSFTVGNNPNRVMNIYSYDPNETPSGCTYNGVSATLVDSSGNGVFRLQSWILVAPATGSNTLSFSGVTGGQILWIVQSYYNASQSGQPDNHGVNRGLASSITLTPNVDNCMLTGACYYGDPATVGVSGIPNHQVSTSATFVGVYDMIGGDNGIIHPASAQTVSVTGTTASGSIAMSIAPVSTVNGNFLTFM